MSNQSHSRSGLMLALRRAMQPLLLVALPIAWAVMTITTALDAGVDIGYDFRGTLWEPAWAVIHGGPIYAAPTPEAVTVGNPSVYPPLFILLATPLTLLAEAAAAWFWAGLLALSVVAALRIVGVRDWRLHVVAVTSPVVVQGLIFGNLTVLLMVPLALAWRYRDRAWVAGAAVAVAVAAKFVAWPLVFWLFFTRRFYAAFVSVVLAIVFVVVPWALIGFEGFREYPELLREVQAVYAKVSLSIASVTAGLGASTTVAATASVLAGAALVALAWWVSRGGDGDRCSFAAVVGACILGTPIVWPNYAALLFVPIAITWRRPAPAWFFGYVIWLAALLPRPSLADVPCCKPQGMPETVWIHLHADPAWEYPAAAMAVVAAVVGLLLVAGNATGASSGPVRHHDRDRVPTLVGREPA